MEEGFVVQGPGVDGGPFLCPHCGGWGVAGGPAAELRADLLPQEVEDEPALEEKEKAWDVR